MNSRVLRIAVLLAAATMVACDEHPVSVDWYVAHPRDLQTKMESCVSKGGDTPNCRAAKNAFLRSRGLAPTF